MPWFFKHCTNAVRLAVPPLLDDADADFDVVLELLPHAASATAAVTATRARIS
jgi:hypothetical protein